MNNAIRTLLIQLLLLLTTTFTATPLTAFASDTERKAIRIAMTDRMTFEEEGTGEVLKVLRLKSGLKYKITFENQGMMRHEVLFGRGAKMEDGTQDGYIHPLFANIPVNLSGSILVNGEKRIWEVETSGITELELDPQNRLSVYFNLPETLRGDWEMGCFVPGHYQMNMKTKIIIE